MPHSSLTERLINSAKRWSFQTPEDNGVRTLRLIVPGVDLVIEHVEYVHSVITRKVVLVAVSLNECRATAPMAIVATPGGRQGRLSLRSKFAFQ